jgi:hypothetical protein
MNKAIHILSYQLQSTDSIAINVGKYIVINLLLEDTLCMNVERNPDSSVLTVHTRPRETAICSVTSDLNFLADISVPDEQYVNVNHLFLYVMKYCLVLLNGCVTQLK